MRRLRKLRAQSLGNHVFEGACEALSISHYIGFAVIKPLTGCPVGRTVLRPLPEESGKGYLRMFKCTCKFEVHTLGVPLKVTGLPFQQQDLGVSACATTALWISLQHARELEHGGVATPSQITIRASQFALPFGRPMPSEGLSLDQMCQAVQSLGYSPSLYRSELHEVTRALLFSSVLSGVSPVLIMELRATGDRHAVAVAGMAIAESRTNASFVEGRANSLELRHRSKDMMALYVHDDRYGPYLKGSIAKRKEQLLIRYEIQDRKEEWTLTHILIPLHPKIRLSFGELYRAGLKLLTSEVQPILEAIGASGVTHWKTLIFRPHVYIDSLLKMPRMDRAVESLCKQVRLSRYIGVIRFEAPSLGTFDVLLDTTSTERNLNCLATVQLDKSKPLTVELCKLIAKNYGAIRVN
jgi:hypothetical protein